MDDTRDKTSEQKETTRIKECLRDNSVLTLLEQLAAEYTAQNRALNQFAQNHTSELLRHMRLQFQIDNDSVELFRRAITPPWPDREDLLRYSYFTDAAQKIAENFEKLHLVAQPEIHEWFSNYVNGRESFLAQFSEAFLGLNFDPILKISDPEPSQVGDINPRDAGLSSEQESALVSIDFLPLRLMEKILQAPHEMKNLNPRQFEEFVAEILQQIGFEDVALTRYARDGGKDIIASKKINGIPLSFYFECKRYLGDNKVNLATVRALLGVMAHDARSVNIGVLVTTSTFTRDAREFILGEARLDGKDYDDLLGWIDEIKTPKV